MLTERLRLTGFLAGFALVCFLRSAAFAEPAEIAGVAKVYLRSGPGTESRPVGILSAGDEVDILETQGSWTKITTLDGKVGFVNGRYVAPRGGSAPSGAAPQLAPSPSAGAAAATPALAVPSPAATGQRETEALSTELEGLRAEVSALRQQIQDGAAENGKAETGGMSTPAVSATPSDGSGSAREQGLGALAVALLSLLVGWVLGSAFGRRRSKSQRPRLRF